MTMVSKEQVWQVTNTRLRKKVTKVLPDELVVVRCHLELAASKVEGKDHAGFSPPLRCCIMPF